MRGHSAPAFNATSRFLADARLEMICDYKDDVSWSLRIATGRNKRARPPKRVSHKPRQGPFQFTENVGFLAGHRPSPTLDNILATMHALDSDLPELRPEVARF